MLRFHLIILMVLTCGALSAQNRLYPVHVNQKWGLMNEQGKLMVAPSYDNIGTFQKGGYAIVEKEGLLGVLDTLGQVIIPCKYPLLDYIGQGLFSVKTTDVWQVINFKDELILDNMAAKISFLEDGYLTYEEITGLGLAHIERGVILPPQFKAFNFLNSNYVTALGAEDLLSLYTVAGERVLVGMYDSISISNDWFWAKHDDKWGSYDLSGKRVIDHLWTSYQAIGTKFYQLKDEDYKSVLYSVTNNAIVLTKVSTFSYFDSDLVQFIREDKNRGLIDENGRILFEGIYDFITKFHENTFRVQEDGMQGILNLDGTEQVPFIYTYISNLNDDVALCRRAKKYGIINKYGKVVLPPALSSSLELRNNTARHKDSKGNLKIFEFDEKGELINDAKFSNLKSLKIRTSGRTFSQRRGSQTAPPINNNYQISDSLCWYFHPGSRRWGLWHIQERRYKFPPKWSNVTVLKDQGISIVGVIKSEVGGRLNTGRLRLKINQVFGIFNNKHGLPVTKMEFLDVRISDYQVLGLDIARCVFVGGKHGILASNGKIVSRGFTYIGEFVEGKARATRKGRLLVDLEQKIKRPLTQARLYYGSLRSKYSFDNDDDPKYFERFRTNGNLYCEAAKWGYIDTFGQVNSKFKYDYVENYSNDRALIRHGGKWGMIDADGNEVLTPAYDNFNFLPNSSKRLFFIAQNQRLYGAIDSNANIIVPVEYTKVRTYHNDRVAVRNLSGRWGFVDRNAKEVIETKYRVVKDFSEGLAIMHDKSRWGALDVAGNVVIKPIYLQMGNFSEGKAWVHLPRGLKGYVNKQGKLLFSNKFSRLTNFKDGIARVYVRKKGWGLIDAEGNYILRPKKSFKKIAAFNEYGIAKVKIGSKYRLINQEGKFVGKRAYGTIKDFKEGLAIVRLHALTTFRLGKPNLNWTFIDTTGALVTKEDFRQLQPFSGGRAGFTSKESSKRGYINQQGKVIIEPIYFRVERFEDNRAVVWDNYNRTGVIDTTGNVIIPVKYNKIIGIHKGLALVRKNSWTYYFVHEDMKRHTPNNFNDAHIFGSTATAVKTAGRWGVINEKGLKTLTAKYADIDPFEKGVAKVCVTTLLGVVDLNGKIIIEPEYEYVEYVGEGLFRVEKGDELGYLNMDGDWIWKMQK